MEIELRLAAKIHKSVSTNDIEKGTVFFGKVGDSNGQLYLLLKVHGMIVSLEGSL